MTESTAAEQLARATEKASEARSHPYGSAHSAAAFAEAHALAAIATATAAVEYVELLREQMSATSAKAGEPFSLGIVADAPRAAKLERDAELEAEMHAERADRRFPARDEMAAELVAPDDVDADLYDAEVERERQAGAVFAEAKAGKSKKASK